MTKIDRRTGKCYLEESSYVDRKLDVVPIDFDGLLRRRQLDKLPSIFPKMPSPLNSSISEAVWEDNWFSGSAPAKQNADVCGITHFHDGWIGFNSSHNIFPLGTNQPVMDDSAVHFAGKLGRVSMVLDWLDVRRCSTCNCWFPKESFETLHIGPTGDSLPGKISTNWHDLNP